MSMFICIEKEDEMKNGNITVKNEGIVEYGNDLKNCKIHHNKDSSKMYYSTFLEILPLNSKFQELFNGI